MKFIHVADVHIGAKFAYLGEKASHKRKQLQQTFRKSIDLAIQEKISLFLIAGDLFDSNYVSQSDVDFVHEQFIRLGEKDIRVCLIGGTHDFLGELPLLKTPGFISDLDYVYLLDSQKPQIYFQDLDVAVTGASNETKKSLQSPIVNIKPHPQARINIALIHGSFQIPGKSSKNDFPFTKDEIEASGFDYIALGHWHSLLDVSSNHTKAMYSGSSEPFEFNQTGSGYGILGEITKSHSLHLSPVKLSSTRFEKIDIDVTSKTALVIKKEIVAHAHADCYASVMLKGFVSPKSFLVSEQIEDDLQDKFAFLHIVDKTTYELTKYDLKEYSPKMILGSFIRTLQKEIKETKDEEEKDIKQKALQLGIALLSGKDLL